MTTLAIDSTRVAAVPAQTTQLSVYSLEHERTLWNAPPQPGFSPKAAAFSADGRFLALYEAATGMRQGRLSVWDAATGKRTSRHLSITRDPGALNPPDVLVVSTGGRRIGSSIESEGLRVDDLETGGVHRDPLGVESLGFSEDGTRLAATLRRHSDVFVVRVFAFDGGIHQIAEFEGARSQAWVGKKLALNMPSGVTLWDGAALHVLAPPIAWPGRVRFSAFGKWLAVYERDPTHPPDHASKLTVYDAEAARPIVEKGGLGAPRSAAVNATRLVAAVERGDDYETFLVQIELSSGKVVSEVSLGASAELGPGDFLIYTGPGGRSVRTLFEPSVLPGGRYVDLYDGADEKHLFRAVTP